MSNAKMALFYQMSEYQLNASKILAKLDMLFKTLDI